MLWRARNAAALASMRHRRRAGIHPRYARVFPTLSGLLAVAGLAMASWVAGVTGPLGPKPAWWSPLAQTSSPPPPLIPQGLVGEWVGTFGAGADSRLSILRVQAGIGAILQSAGYRETFRVQAIGGSGVMLVPLSVTRANGQSAPNYSLDSAWFDLSPDLRRISGYCRNARRATGAISMRRPGGR